MFTNAPITSFTAGLLGFMLVYLLYLVIQVRRVDGISIGTGNNELLEFRILGHANFTETVPISLFLLYLIEINGVPQFLITTLATLLVLARASHAYAFMYIHETSVHFNCRVIAVLAQRYIEYDSTLE